VNQLKIVQLRSAAAEEVGNLKLVLFDDCSELVESETLIQNERILGLLHQMIN
jgi:hypothetical protein